jgi:hypothetical protein
MSGLLGYENFNSASDVAAYRRVKLRAMYAGTTARRIACEMVGGEITSRGPEYVKTKHGLYALPPRSNSMNTVQRFAASEYGAEIVVMDDSEQMSEWFRMHGVKNGNRTLIGRLRKAMAKYVNP